MKKKMLALVLVVMMISMVSVSAMAASGFVDTDTFGNGGRLNIRKTANSGSAIIGYMDNGTSVTIHGESNGMTNVSGWGYTDPKDKSGSRAYISGWAVSHFISMNAR